MVNLKQSTSQSIAMPTDALETNPPESHDIGLCDETEIQQEHANYTHIVVGQEAEPHETDKPFTYHLCKYR